ncbi:MAG: protein phosphatase 2C domain-containing protein [Wenzhouxiangellaceae bacterium]|nr:protein phosphatase 2C domain-containing protein [Wenzhouxiangellaceae bacterium]
MRPSNQDRVLARPEIGLWVVADGMGGHAGGAQASRLACEAVEEAVGHGMPLEDAFEVAHARVRDAQSKASSLADMGTTLVAVLEREQAYDLAWVGDSRAYRYRASNGQFECLSQDHNLAGRLVRNGSITIEQARSHPHRHILTDCIGQRVGLPTVESHAHEWQAGDRLLLCSDGLSGELPDEEIAQWLTSIRSPKAVTEKLIHRALEAGGRDNISLIVLDAPVG